MIITLKRSAAAAVILLVLVALLLGGRWYYVEKVRVIPEELLKESLTNTLELNSYRYHVTTNIMLDGQQQRKLSDISGEKSKKEFHIKGEMAGQQVEAYQVNDITYSLHPKTGRWMVTPGTELFQPELFMIEINPLSNFKYTEINNIQYNGVEKSDGGKKLHLITYAPTVKNEFLEKYWHNFTYQVWIDRGTERIIKAKITANSIKDTKDTVTITIEVKDFNKKISINPPQED